ncbi:hypothetical protein PRIPAC_76090 [Pristionchus pacificus]|uniref:G protein-coupled receptor n=1 Tax=Pristionchus pacificus TaxID=54126 RepID=A0A2A6BEJ1_PRIPA|nr:hypothetical protein PRIPAC_76090 [Pristionchus pacificus]|eukprot:PDM64288.1 G protein-coupled receptor [Pristionchus pacificus]
MDDPSISPAIPNDTLWCFDMELYYQSLQDNARREEMTSRINQYKNFSFRVNGVLTLVVTLFGFFGTYLLLSQIRNSRLFSRRLSIHMGMLCLWDTVMLMSCLLTYCFPSLIYHITPFYGPIAYILFVFQPVASACVSAGIWQVLIITLERYLAVTRPLEQRTLKAQFGLRAICLVIVLSVIFLNVIPVPFDRALVPCFELTDTEEVVTFWTLLKPYDDDPTRQKIGTLLHVIPDILFRAPLPIVIIAILTVKTIQVCNNRTPFANMAMNHPAATGVRSTIPLRLSLLSFKFILCNSLYMFNSVLIEVLGIGHSDTAEHGEVDDTVDMYWNSFYLSDASNMLLVLHSATNWIVFYHWPRCKARKIRKHSSKHSTVSAYTAYTSYAREMNPNIAQTILKRFMPAKERIGAEIITTLCLEIPRISELVTGMPHFTPVMISTDVENKINSWGARLSRFIEINLKWFADYSSSYDVLRRQCRKAGQSHFEAKLHLSPDEWKIVRRTCVRVLIRNTTKIAITKEREMEAEKVEEFLTRAFNSILSETRSGLLCAAVEATQRSQRHEYWRDPSSLSQSQHPLISLND